MSDSTWLIEWWSVFNSVENNQIGKKKKLHIIVIQENKELIIFPLVSLSRSIKGVSLRYLEILSQQWGGCESEILCSSILAHHLIPIVFKYIEENIKHDILQFKYLLDDSCIFEKQKFFIHGISPYISIAEHTNHEEFKKNKYSKKLKQNIRTAFNKVKKNNYNIEILKTEINDSLFESIKKISKSKLIDGKHSVYLDSNKSKFYSNIYKKFKSNVILIKINNEFVSYRVNIIKNNKKFCIDASFNRDFRRFDLGAISVDSNISDSFENNLFVHSMGPGDDSYKFKYTNTVEFLYTFIKKGNSFKSFFFYPMFRYVLKKRQNKYLNNYSETK